MQELRALPAVGAVLSRPGIVALIEQHGSAIVTRAVRESIESARRAIVQTGHAEEITDAVVTARIHVLHRDSLARVSNATGVVVHTNLGRIPLAREATLAIEMGAVADDLRLTIHPHPTLSEAIMEAAAASQGEAIHIMNR